MSSDVAGSCKENGLIGFMRKLLGQSLPEGIGRVTSDEIREDVSDEVREEIRRREEEQQRTLWDDKSQLYAQPLKKKGLTADPSAAYGLFGFMGTNYDKDGEFDENGSPLTLKLTGKFPKAQYMSLQIYRGKPFQTSEDVGNVLSDYEIQAKPGGKNPFQTGDPDDEGKFKITITPDKNDERKPNHIYYEPKASPGDSAVITGFYRVYLPEGEEITAADLPKIKAFDADGDPVKPTYVDLVDDWFLHIPGARLASNLLIPELKELPWLNLDCVSTTPSGLGSNQDLHYIASFSKVPVGKYVVVKFRAPAVYFGNPDDIDEQAVRYWSICSVYYPTLTTMNSLACKPGQSPARDVTLVFGKDRPGIRAKARSLGAEFLPDAREPDEDVLTIMLRNMLATNALKPQVFKGRFAPTAEVFSLREFLDLPEPDED